MIARGRRCPRSLLQLSGSVVTLFSLLILCRTSGQFSSRCFQFSSGGANLRSRMLAFDLGPSCGNDRSLYTPGSHDVRQVEPSQREVSVGGWCPCPESERTAAFFLLVKLFVFVNGPFVKDPILNIEDFEL